MKNNIFWVTSGNFQKQTKFKLSILTISIVLNIVLLFADALFLAKKGGVSYLKQKIFGDSQPAASSTAGAKKPLPAYLNRQSLFAQLPDTQDEIIFLGDSMVSNCEWAELFGNPQIKNRGIAGDTPQGLLERLSQITAGKPKKIFLMVGINSLGDNTRDPQKVLTIGGQYRQVLARIREQTPETQVYVQSVLPVHNVLWAKSRLLEKKGKITVDSDDVTRLNRELEALAKEFGYRYIDLYSLFVKNLQLNPQYSNDGLHLNGAGYLVWKQAIQQYVN